MTKRKGNLMTVRSDVKVLDATIRDGGYCNNFEFTDEFVIELFWSILRCGVDYMEFGYKASKRLFDKSAFGKWKFCEEEDIRAIVGNNESPMKIAVMADVGRCDFKEDFLPKSESVIDMVRVACYIHQIPAALEMISHFNKLGYETSCNIMAISQVSEAEIESALDMLGLSPVDVIYLVDSFGYFYPESVAEKAKKYVEYAEKYGKTVGFHGHNNQNLAFANTIEALSYGVSYLDATVSGMGRGAGNCAMESLLGFLKNPKYNLFPVLSFIENHIPKLKADGVQWGFDIQYMITGLHNCHPKDAIRFTSEHRTDYSAFYRDILDV